MPNFDTPHNEAVAAQVWLDASANINQSKQEQLSRIAKLQNPALKTLAEKQLQNLQGLEVQNQADQQAIAEARIEFKENIDALMLLQRKFWQLADFENFADFLTGNKLSELELESLYDFLNSQSRTALKEFRKNGFPTSRQSYLILAIKFGIQTSSDLNDKFDARNQQLFLNSLPTLKSVQHLPEVTELSKLISELESLEWTEAQEQMNTIVGFLVWADRQSWELDTILVALKKQDAENTANGNPTKHFETFTRTVRDFSPDISSRIDIFVANYNAETSGEAVQVSSYQKAIIEGAIPNGSDLDMKTPNTFVATTPDGDTIQVIKNGDYLSRSYSLNGSDFALQTPLQRSDFAEAVAEYETVNQEFWPKLRKAQNTLAFLENPTYSDIPLTDMQEGLRKTLGYSLYEKLNVRNVTDKTSLVSLLKSNIADYQQELSQAKRGYEKAMQIAVTENKRHNAEADEKIKTTLKALRNSGLEFLDINYLISHMQAGFITPDIWVPFDRQNLDLASQNFWEPLAETNNPTKHIEYIYRLANKVLTGSADGMTDGKLIGFSLDQAILNPDVAQKTDGEVKHLLKQSGAWSEGMGVDKAKVEKILVKPISPALG